MKKKVFNLTATDFLAIQNKEDNYLYNKGNLTHGEDSVEYYRLAAVMGNIEAIKALGTYYLNAFGQEKNIKLASAYFTIAANKGDIEAIHMLGFINGSEYYEINNQERATYYYRKAVGLILKDFTESGVLYEENLDKYPLLCLDMAKALLSGEYIEKDLGLSYLFARRSYWGCKKGNYKNGVQKAEEFMKLKDFDNIRKAYDVRFNNRYHDAFEDEDLSEYENTNEDDDISFEDIDIDDIDPDDCPF